MTLLLLALGGAAGTVSRYAVGGWVSDLTGGQWPWGTFVVNVSGSFVLGLLFALSIERDLLPAEIRGPLMIGFLSAYTTFSTLMLESWRLVEGGAVLAALLNVLGSSVVGIGAVLAGLMLGRLLS